MRYSLGLDFGTTNTRIAFFHNGEALTYRITHGGMNDRDYIPSVMASRDGRSWFAWEAYNMFRGEEVGPDEYYERFKMYLHQASAELWHKNKTAAVVTKDFIAALLERFKRDHGEIEHIVCSVPELWQNDPANPGATVLQRILKDELGLPLLRLIPEPVAAAIAYCWRREAPGRLLVCDMGGGTFDVSLVEATATHIKVLQNSGAGVRNEGKAGAVFDRNIARILWDKAHPAGEAPSELDLLALKDVWETRKTTPCTPLESALDRLQHGSIDEESLSSMLLYRNVSGQTLTFGDLTQAFEPVADGIRSALSEFKAVAFDKLIIVGGFGKYSLVVHHIRKSLGCDDARWAQIFDTEFHASAQSIFAIAKGAALLSAGQVEVSEKYQHTIGVRYFQQDASHDEIIYAQGTIVTNDILWSRLTFRIGAQDGDKVMVPLFVDPRGDSRLRIRRDVPIPVDSERRNARFRVGVMVDSRNKAIVFLCDEESHSSGHTKRSARHEIEELLPALIAYQGED